MKMKQINNDELKEALKDSKEVFNAVNSFTGCDDEQLAKIQKFNLLTQFEKDLMYLCATHSVIEVAGLYGCSRQYIYKLLDKIKNKL